MNELEQKIRSEAERLLKENLVDVVIAFRKEDAGSPGWRQWLPPAGGRRQTAA